MNRACGIYQRSFDTCCFAGIVVTLMRLRIVEIGGRVEIVEKTTPFCSTHTYARARVYVYRGLTKRSENSTLSTFSPGAATRDLCFDAGIEYEPDSTSAFDAYRQATEVSVRPTLGRDTLRRLRPTTANFTPSHGFEGTPSTRTRGLRDQRSESISINSDADRARLEHFACLDAEARITWMEETGTAGERGSTSINHAEPRECARGIRCPQDLKHPTFSTFPNRGDGIGCVSLALRPTDRQRGPANRRLKRDMANLTSPNVGAKS